MIITPHHLIVPILHYACQYLNLNSKLTSRVEDGVGAYLTGRSNIGVLDNKSTRTRKYLPESPEQNAGLSSLSNYLP